MGTANGLVKEVDVALKMVAGSWGTQSLHNEVDQMCFGQGNRSVLIARADGSIVEICLENFSLLRNWVNENENVSSSVSLLQKDLRRICGLSCLENKIFSCRKNGIFQIHSSTVGSKVSREICFEFSPRANRKRHIEKMRSSATHSVVAIGGKEQELSLFDVENGKNLFKAKNVRHDKLDHRVPVWITDLQFIEESKIVTGTRYHQVRLYDTRAQRRPVIDVLHGEDPINCLITNPFQNRENPMTFEVITGDIVGNILLYDLRHAGVPTGKYKGPVGSVRSLCIGRTNGEERKAVLISCGLDRHLYIHDLKTRKRLEKLYLKQRLSHVLGLDSLKENVNEDERKEEESCEEQNEETIFQQLEELDGGSRKRDSPQTQSCQTPLKRKKKD